MTTLLERIADYNNLYWAWNKAKNIYQPGDIWFNELEVAGFEADLSNQLLGIREEILSGEYELANIYPIAYPKGRDEKGPRTRQTFWVSVRDQVAWLAVVNVIGGYIDAQMPFWSYGNRLYLTIFYEEDGQDRADRKYGYYRNTTRNLFRKWKQSWPMYRQHINLTARLMAKPEKEVKQNLEEAEQDVFSNNEKLDNRHPMQAAYLLPGYFSGGSKEHLYWAGIDLEKFYPNIRLDVVKKNIATVLAAMPDIQELMALIDRLLAFRIDLNGWNDRELGWITLTPGEPDFPHMPTGLFVAGFLANTALLAVDLQVKAKLEKNRNIAHFRFVDDHVILSTDFDSLINWINDYKALLKAAGVGTDINLEKTEPKALGEYYRAPEGMKPAVKERLLRAAKVASELDPDFPNPLMTQTLAKVSKIARTEFNLLSPEEEKTLIADVEHLLITEFPDHELRRDTRVSFAARMLSSMIPRMTIDSSKLYELHKGIAFNNKLLTDYRTAMEETINIGKKEKLAADITRISLDINNLEKNLDIEKKHLRKQEEQLSRRTVKLLIKAVHENHEKVRLWARLLEFFQRSGNEKPILVTTEIQKLIERKVTRKLSATFIYSLVLQVLATLVLDAIKVVGSNQHSQRKKRRALNFILHMLDPELLAALKKANNGKSKNYQQLSLKLFQCSLGTAIFLLQTEFPEQAPELSKGFLKKYGLLDWNHQPRAFFKSSGYDTGTWAWWLLNKLPAPPMGEPPLLWRQLNQFADLEKSIDRNLVFRYPRFLPLRLLNQLAHISADELRENEGVLFDITIGRYARHALQFLPEISRKTQPKSGQASLFAWIEWMHEKQQRQISAEHQTMQFDPRLGEWAALMIISKVAAAVNIAMTPTFDAEPAFTAYMCIHPNNFLLPNAWMDNQQGVLTWEALGQLFSEGEVTFRDPDELIIDKRYLPTFGLDPDKEFQAALNGLGSLLISLLAKHTSLPDKWNPLGQQQAWMGLARAKLKHVAVSSYTNDIIAGCFSPRNVETRWFKNIGLKENFSFDIADDNKLDPPSFADIDDFLKYIDMAMGRLKNQQISVSMHQPRQLTPVSLIQLKEKQYQQLLKGEDLNL